MTKQYVLSIIEGQRTKKFIHILRVIFLPKEENFSEKIVISSEKSDGKIYSVSKWTKFSSPSSLGDLTEAIIKAWYFLLREKGKTPREAVQIITRRLYYGENAILHNLEEYYRFKKRKFNDRGNQRDL